MKLPVNTVEKLKILKELYEEDWGTAVSYDQIIERLLGSGSLGALDPGIYRRFSAIVDSRDDFEDLVKKSTSAAVDELAVRADVNGTTLREEARREQVRAIKEMEELHSAVPSHRYWFVGEGGEYDAYDGKWGIVADMTDPDTGDNLAAIDMFNKGYVLRRDDGKEFTSTFITLQEGGEDVKCIAYRLTDYDGQ